MSFACSARARSARRAAVAAALLAFAGGCGGRGDVSGKVTYQGKPLVWGTVQFEGSDGMLKQANINSDGTYSVQGMATGEAKVAVSSINPKSSDFQPRVVEGRPGPPPRPEVQGWFPIPDKYDTPHKSGLVYTIKSGPNTIDIDLK
ncbi:MAG TPA: hypothetical protein VKE74_04445 [Gemmataceae bacterium]|nr:hypothetical protein [Gemmataceae bacterium]